MAYFSNGNLNHNGVEYAKGQEVADLTPDQAAGLLQFGAITEEEIAADEIVEPGVTPASVEPIDHEANGWKEELAPSEIQTPLEVAAAEQPQVSEPQQDVSAEQSAAQSEVPGAPVPVSVKVEKIK